MDDYKQLLNILNTMIKNGRVDSEAADLLREYLSKKWNNLTEEEKAEINKPWDGLS